MADAPISGFTDGNPPVSTDIFVAGRGTGNVKFTWAEILAALPSGSSPSVVTSLPGSPTDGEEVYYKVGTGDTATLWHLRYDSSITDAHKWRVLGCQDIHAEVVTDESTSSSTYGDLTTVGPSVTVPLAGVYEVQFGAGCYSTVNGTDATASVSLGGSTPSDNDAIRHRGISTSSQLSVSSPSRILARETLAAGDTVVMKYHAGNVAGAGHFFNRWLTVRPIRLG